MTTQFTLQFSTGESVPVHGQGLIGRSPAPEPGEYVDHLLRVTDPSRSVSKTHLEFGQQDDWFWVMDRYSSNGTMVVDDRGHRRRVDPASRVRVERGWRVEIGDQFFLVV